MPSPAPPRAIAKNERFRAYFSLTTVEFHLLVPGELPSVSTRLARFAREGGVDAALREAAEAANLALENWQDAVTHALAVAKETATGPEA